jgi:BirA family biotin operon repressor/biotin-[acetyl-CoA-carboxylase] ligase
MKKKILSELSSREGYVSGQELCEALQVSRTAVWKVINQLKEEGYEIESVSRKGYRIISRPDVITAEEVESRLCTKWAGHPVCYYQTTGSTNNDAARLADEGAPQGTLVVAETQGQGKGRRGRTWITPAGTSIAMSLLMRPQIAPEHASMVTLVMGLAVADACREVCGVRAGIKWPNDVVAEGRKICGILTEMTSEIDYVKYLVIGIGINTSTEAFPEELSDRAVSLYQLTGHRPVRAQLIASCMKYFEEYYEIFARTEDLSQLMESYNALLAGRGERVRVLEPGHEYEGVSEGINARGELMVRREDGTVTNVYAGEVSVRGIYGYI